MNSNLEQEGKEAMEDTVTEETQLALEQEVVEELPPLNGFMLANGCPLFLGEVKDIIERVQALEDPNYPIFYVLGSYKMPYETTTNGVKTKGFSAPEPRVFRVISNFIGFSIDTVDTDALSLTNLVPTATMGLPLIPYELIQKLDAFFRQVNSKQHTEAICMLTYDPRLEGSDGWGILVPEQHNNASHCNYKPESIIEDKDDEVFIVGTAHSHPGMSAFASHTDHGDQSAFDGIHLTFGWKSGSNVTEHYIELQMGGTAFVMTEDQAFTDAPEPPTFPEVEGWLTKVNKETYLPNFNMGRSPAGSTMTNSPGASGSTSSWSGFDSSRSGSSHYDANQKPYTLPEGCPDPDKNTVVTRLLGDSELRCPVCNNFLDKNIIETRRRCWACYVYLLKEDETIEDIVTIRNERNSPTWELIPDRASKDIYLYERWIEDNDGKQEVATSIEKVFVFDVGEAGKV